MKVAKYIDPCTYYEETPPSGRPFIMSPYAACMNVLCAWPAPSRAHDAVVVLRHTGSKSSDGTPDRPASPLVDPEKKGDAHNALTASSSAGADEDEEEDVVPREGLSRSGSKHAGAGEKTSKPAKRRTWLGGMGNVFGGAHKEERVLKKYWRFVGFKDEPRVRALLEAHNAKLESRRNLLAEDRKPAQRSASTASTESGNGAAEVQHGIEADHPTLRKLGTTVRSKIPNFGQEDFGTPQLKVQSNGSGGDISPLESSDAFFTAPEPPPRVMSPAALENDTSIAAPSLSAGSSGVSSSAGSSASSRAQSHPAPEMPPLARITTNIRSEAERTAKTDGLREEDFKLADELQRKTRLGDWESKLDDKLGPWRFQDPGTDMVEDNAFIFTNESLSVPKRRKHFAKQENRESFKYDPDVVYGASFFTDAMDFNTFNLGLGPVSLNVARWFKTMPVRYTLRAAKEEPVFCTISFQLVD